MRQTSPSGVHPLNVGNPNPNPRYTNLSLAHLSTEATLSIPLVIHDHFFTSNNNMNSHNV